MNCFQGDRDGEQILLGDVETRIVCDEDDDVIRQTIVYFTGPWVVLVLCLPMGLFGLPGVTIDKPIRRDLDT
jgi:hypothetical protein